MIYIKKLKLLEEHCGSFVNHHFLHRFSLIPDNIIFINQAAKKIADFIGLNGYTIIVSRKKLAEKTGGQIELQNQEKFVFIDISEELYDPSSILAALAHELSHQFLYIHGLYATIPAQNNYEREIFTDITAVYLGLGNLMLNGCEVTTESNNYTHTQNVGYLKLNELGYVYFLVCKMRDIPKSEFTHKLNPKALNAVLKWNELHFNEIQTQKFRELKYIADFYNKQRSIISKLTQMKKRIDTADSDILKIFQQSTNLQLEQIGINKIHWFWNISRRDSELMADFTLSAGSYFPEIKDSLHKIESRRKTLINQLTNLTKDKDLVTPFEYKYIKLEQNLIKIENKIQVIPNRLDAIDSIHKKYYSQINWIEDECCHFLPKIEKSKDLLGDIKLLHNYYSENPRVWIDYKNDDITKKVQSLIDTDECYLILSNIENNLDNVNRLVESIRNADFEYFPKDFNILKLTDNLKRDEEKITKIFNNLTFVQSKQNFHIEHYINKCEWLLDVIDSNNNATKIGMDKFGQIKKRQELINSNHALLKINSNPEPEFSIITASIHSCSIESELSQILSKSERMKQNLRTDIRRVREFKDGDLITGIETYLKEYQEIIDSLREIKANIIRWYGIQAKYITKLRKMKKNSISNQFKKMLRK